MLPEKRLVSASTGVTAGHALASARRMLRRDIALTCRSVVLLALASLAATTLLPPAVGAQTPFPDLSRRLRVAAQPVDFLLVIDRSASMRASWPAVVRAVEQYAPSMAGGHLAIVGFDDTAYDLITSGSVQGAAADFVAQLRRVGPPAGQHTNIQAGMRAACDWLALRQRERAQVVVLVSDGKHEPATGTLDASAQIGSQCQSIAKVRDVTFLAVGVPPSIDFSEYHRLLAPAIRLEEVRVGVGDLAALLQRMRLLALARREVAGARGRSGWVQVDSVVPHTGQDRRHADLADHERARVFATLRSPFAHLRACFASHEIAERSNLHVDVIAPKLSDRCMDVGDTVRLTFSVAERAPQGTWERLARSLRPSSSRQEQLTLEVRAALRPEPQMELAALGDTTLLSVPATGGMSLPASFSGGTHPLVHALSTLVLCLLGLTRWPAPRLWGHIGPATPPRSPKPTKALPDAVDLGGVGASRYLYELPDGSRLPLVARKLNPVGLRGGRSKVGIDFTTPVDAYVTDANGTVLSPDRRSIVWLDAGARITVNQANGTGPIDLQWN